MNLRIQLRLLYPLVCSISVLGLESLPAPKVPRRCVGARRLEDQLLDKQLKL